MTEGLKPGWRRWRFEQMATNVNERVDDPSEAGVDYYVGLEHLDSDSLKIRRWGSPDDVSATKLLFEPGDIIFGRRRAYQRKLGVAEWRGIASAHSLVLRGKPDVVLPEFLPFFMQSDLFMDRAQRISVGSLSPTINWKTLAKEEFALPPLEEQRRITVAYTALDNLAEELRVTFAILKQLRESVVHSFLFCEEVSFTEEKLGELGSVSYGLTVNQARRRNSNLRPYLRVANVQRGRFDLSEIKQIGTLDGDESYELQAGDMLLVEGHADVNEIGRCAVWTGELSNALHQNHLIRFRPNTDRVLPAYALAFINSSPGKGYFRSRAKSTSGLNTINSSVVKDLPILVAAMPEQEAFCNRLRELDESVLAVKLRLSKALRMRQALSTEALS
jgi:type I restriction enzyme, S subunit